MTEAATIAQDKLEELRVSTWGVISDGNDILVPSSTGINYSRNWVVVSNTDDTLKTVRITVSWNDGINRSIRLLSAISN